MRVVFDTDVLIPLVIDASRPARLLSRLLSSGHDVVVSPAILDEVADKMRTKRNLRNWLRLADEDIEQFLSDLPSYCTVVSGAMLAEGSVPRDSKDEKIIAAAIEGRAKYIISEDKHLLSLREFAGIKIMNRNQFMVELDQLGFA